MKNVNEVTYFNGEKLVTRVAEGYNAMIFVDFEKKLIKIQHADETLTTIKADFIEAKSGIRKV